MNEVNVFANPNLYLMLIYMVMQLRTIQIFLTHEQYRSATCFRILTAIALFDVLMLLRNIQTSCYTFPLAVNKYLNAFFAAVYYTLFPMHLLVAINRLCVFFKLYILADYCSADQRWEKRVHWVAFLLLGIYFFAIFIFSELQNIAWLFIKTNINIWLNSIGSVVSPMVCLLIYLLIFAIIKWANGKFHSTTTHSAIAASQKKTEHRIMSQSLVQFAVFFWFPLGTLLPLEWTASSSSYYYTFRVYMGPFVYGVNPITNLFFLPDFRQNFLPDFVLSIGRHLVRKNITTTTESNPNVFMVRSVQQPQSTIINTSVMTQVGRYR